MNGFFVVEMSKDVRMNRKSIHNDDKESTDTYRSVKFLQSSRLSSSILLQFWANVCNAASVTDLQPRKLSDLRNPPQRRLIFSTTGPSMSVWK